MIIITFFSEMKVFKISEAEAQPDDDGESRRCVIEVQEDNSWTFKKKWRKIEQVKRRPGGGRKKEGLEPKIKRMEAEVQHLANDYRQKMTSKILESHFEENKEAEVTLLDIFLVNQAKPESLLISSEVKENIVPM